jgi:hypothetical protein
MPATARPKESVCLPTVGIASVLRGNCPTETESDVQGNGASYASCSYVSTPTLNHFRFY